MPDLQPDPAAVKWGGFPERQVMDAIKRGVHRAMALQAGDKKLVNIGANVCIHGDGGEDDYTTFMVGRIPDAERRDLTIELCVEKAKRVLQNPDHVLSWQSRDPADKKYGGGVKVFVNGHWLAIAVSGLSPDLIDEAAVLLAMQELGWLSPGECKRYARISGNSPYIYTQV